MAIFANTPWWKNDDRLEMTSKFSRRTPHLWDYSFFIQLQDAIYIWLLYGR